MEPRSFGDLIELVRQGYRDAALAYNEQKDNTILNHPIFHHWLSLIPRPGIVAELGCGSGHPVAHHLDNLWRGSGNTYIGVDLSEEQVDLAKQALGRSDTVSFTVREMTDWCRKQKDGTISGLLCLFSVFHLPRAQHVELFTHMARVLADGAPLLFTTPATASEGFQERWLGTSAMYWSSFSVGWYEVTCSDLGLDFVSKSREVKEFPNGEKEVTYSLLYRKPHRPPSATWDDSNTLIPTPQQMQDYLKMYGPFGIEDMQSNS